MTSPPSPRRILVAPDKFKGTLDAPQAAAAITHALSSVWPDTDIVPFPIADGGEGSVDVALAHGFEEVTTTVQGPLGADVEASIALRGGTAVVEASLAIGRTLLPGGEVTRRTALTSSTYGVGQLIRAAARTGADDVLVCVGGSVTTDGGLGALRALGLDALGADGTPVPPGGRGLLDLVRIDWADGAPDLGGRHPRITVGVDVEATLTGPQGAATMFGPQKGAGPAELDLLERGLEHWATFWSTSGATPYAPGAGAAGGLGFGLAAGLGAALTPGLDALLERVGMDTIAQGCDLVIVGEGSLDQQSLLGKGPVRLARRLRATGARTVAVVGRSSIDHADAHAAGLDAVISVSDLVGGDASLNRTAWAIAEAVRRRIRAAAQVNAERAAWTK